MLIWPVFGWETVLPNCLILHDDPDQLRGRRSIFLVDDVRFSVCVRRDGLKLKFMSPPAQIARGYRATVKDPFGNILLLLDHTAAAGSSAVEDAKPAGSLFAGIEPRVAVKKAALIAAYEKIGRTADDLPYTPHFESLYSGYAASHPDPKPTRAEVWRHLLNLRKGSKLPKLGEARSVPPEISPEAREKLKQMLGPDIGKRDRLPYTKRF